MQMWKLREEMAKSGDPHLEKLAANLTSEQLDTLVECFDRAQTPDDPWDSEDDAGVFIKYSELKSGDWVFCDEDFTCMPAGHKQVLEDTNGLYVQCGEGKHYLSGQVTDDGDTLAGMYNPTLFKAT